MANIDVTIGNGVKITIMAIVGFIVFRAVAGALGLGSIQARIPS